MKPQHSFGETMTAPQRAQPYERSIGKQGHTEQAKVLEMPPARGSDKTVLPNWFMGAICTAFILLIGFAYTQIEKRITSIETNADKRVEDIRSIYKERTDSFERRLELQETYMRNTREWLKEYGFDIADDGKITRRERR